MDIYSTFKNNLNNEGTVKRFLLENRLRAFLNSFLKTP